VVGDVRAERVGVRQFRSYERAACELPDGVALLRGANGAGKTNLLEAVYFACCGRSPRTSNERELVRWGADGAHVALETSSEGYAHSLSVALRPGESKLLLVDGKQIEGVVAGEVRPLVCVFMAERIKLVKGPPAARRAHLDELVVALWPSRRDLRRQYATALAQRNALLSAIRWGRSTRASLPAWDLELAKHALRLRDARAEAAGRLLAPLCQRGKALGFAGELSIQYRSGSAAGDVEGFVSELDQRAALDLERGFSTHGPQRDEIVLSYKGRELRRFGSQGEQRLALLALLLAERELLARERGTLPLMLLDDVLGELDHTRRGLLLEELADGGQSVITSAEPHQVPSVSRTRLATIEIPGDVCAGPVDISDSADRVPSGGAVATVRASPGCASANGRAA
jgi:DNA replication and repair protein RecF